MTARCSPRRGLRRSARFRILAVDLGRLGFLAPVAQDEIYLILDEIFSGKHRVSERVMLEAEIVRGGTVIRRRSR